jgi:hypothetical protein
MCPSFFDPIPELEEETKCGGGKIIQLVEIHHYVLGVSVI